MCWTHPNALYEGILVVNTYYDKIENFMKIYAQMDPKSHPKIDIWAIRGPTFEVFGRVLRNAILNTFSIGKNLAIFCKKLRFECELGVRCRSSGSEGWGSASEAGALGRVLGRYYKFWELRPTRLAPPSKDGVGGFKGYRLCRRPLLNQVLAILRDL